MILSEEAVLICGAGTWKPRAGKQPFSTLWTKRQRELGCRGEWCQWKDGFVLPGSNPLLRPGCMPAHRFRKISSYPCLLKQPKESLLTHSVTFNLCSITFPKRERKAIVCASLKAKSASTWLKLSILLLLRKVKPLLGLPPAWHRRLGVIWSFPLHYWGSQEQLSRSLFLSWRRFFMTLELLGTPEVLVRLMSWDPSCLRTWTADYKHYCRKLC